MLPTSGRAGESFASAALEDLPADCSRRRSIMSRQTIEFRLDVSRVALRTNPMAELGIRVVADVAFHLLPVIAIVADFLAIRTNGQQPLQSFDARKGVLQLPDSLR